MIQERKLTTIDLPHGVLQVVGDILQKAGFTLGTVGSGYGMMEREGDISEEEKSKLIKAMSAELFEFDVQDLEEDEGE